MSAWQPIPAQVGSDTCDPIRVYSNTAGKGLTPLGRPDLGVEPFWTRGVFGTPVVCPRVPDT
eukprot:1092332-Prymnesium_polylepis.1